MYIVFKVTAFFVLFQVNLLFIRCDFSHIWHFHGHEVRFWGKSSSPSYLTIKKLNQSWNANAHQLVSRGGGHWREEWGTLAGGRVNGDGVVELGWGPPFPPQPLTTTDGMVEGGDGVGRRESPKRDKLSPCVLNSEAICQGRSPWSAVTHASELPFLMMARPSVGVDTAPTIGWTGRQLGGYKRVKVQSHSSREREEGGGRSLWHINSHAGRQKARPSPSQPHLPHPTERARRSQNQTFNRHPPPPLGKIKWVPSFNFS